MLVGRPGTPEAALPHGSASLPADVKYDIGQPPSVPLWGWGGGKEVLPSPFDSPETTGTSQDRRQPASDFIRLGSKAKQNPPCWERAGEGTGHGGIAANVDVHLLQLSGEGGKVHHLL